MYLSLSRLIWIRIIFLRWTFATWWQRKKLPASFPRIFLGKKAQNSNFHFKGKQKWNSAYLEHRSCTLPIYSWVWEENLLLSVTSSHIWLCPLVHNHSSTSVLFFWQNFGIFQQRNWEIIGIQIILLIFFQISPIFLIQKKKKKKPDLNKNNKIIQSHTAYHERCSSCRFITGSRVIMLSIIFEDIGWYDLKHSTMKIRSHIIMCIMWLPSQLHLLILL